ncbi:MAG: multidrug efflux pump subunit AcrA (membrane-fusion protein) [Chlamydiales bacterium]|jgi:multidrug efflux pump subunit AcrA (membrane-fusion protein)
MSSTQNTVLKRLGPMGLAIAFLVLSILVTSSLIFNKSRGTRTNGIRENIPTVEIQPVSRDTHPVYVNTFGSIQAEKTVTLRAPVSGKILKSMDLYPGRTVEPNEILFTIEKTKIDLAIRTVKLQIEELSINESKLNQQEDILISRLGNANELYKLAESTHIEQLSILEIEQKLFDNTQELFKGENISNTEFLRSKTSIQKAELANLESRKQMQNSLDNIHRLEMDLSTTQQQLLLIENKRQTLGVRMEELQDDLSKSDVKVDFPVEVVEVFADSGQEVSPNSDLAKVRSFDAAEIVVNIPDSHFEWLYRGDLLESTKQDLPDSIINIRLVNHDFEKVFGGAYIKSISGSVNIPTRSLPMVIARRNPTDENGKIISKEEMIPGMYCAVRLKLCDLNNTFLIPPQSIQPNHSILHVVLNDKSEKTEVSVIENFKVLYESEEGVIVSLPEELEHLLIITHELKDVGNNDQVYINNVENF